MGNMNYLLPSEVATLSCELSTKKSGLSITKLLILGLPAGVYIGFGANMATLVSCDAAKYFGSGVGQLLFGAVFSAGLMMVVIAGGELFTGNNMYMLMGVLNRNCTWRDLIRNWVVVYIANFAGALLLVYLIMVSYYGNLPPAPVTTGLFKGAVGAKALLIAKGKLELSWMSAFARAILCNWLVCLAIWMSLASKDIIGKIWAIFFPITVFVACGFEHSIANMFYIPMGMAMAQIPGVIEVASHSVLTLQQMASYTATGTIPTDALSQIAEFKVIIPELFTWRHFLVNNLLPVTLGNIIGGTVFVGALYWYAYKR